MASIEPRLIGTATSVRQQRDAAEAQARQRAEADVSGSHVRVFNAATYTELVRDALAHQQVRDAGRAKERREVAEALQGCAPLLICRYPLRRAFVAAPRSPCPLRTCAQLAATSTPRSS